jgi:antitoxin component of MazEF toxin-antitoxin module
MSKQVLTRKTDAKGRVTLTKAFANCVVTVEVHGEEIRIRKAKQSRPCKYSLKKLMTGVTAQKLHPEFDTGPPVGGEVL